MGKLSFRRWWLETTLAAPNDEVLRMEMQGRLLVNPSKYDIDAHREERRVRDYRGIIDKGGTVYLWPEDDGEHMTMARRLGLNADVYFYAQSFGGGYSVSTSDWSHGRSDIERADKVLHSHPRIARWH